MRGHWRETALLSAIAALLIAWLTRKGITTFFFAEAFVYLGSYHAAGDSFVRTLLRPHGMIFYRPSLWAVNLAWNLIAPPDALLYHLRNYAFVVLDALLLHRLLLRIVPNAFGRTVAILFFAVSKVHLTTIGYVATFSTILLLTATLAMCVAFLRWLESQRRVDYAATLFFAAFLIFSKDYGGVAVLLLPILAWNVRSTVRSFAIPIVALVVLYAILRAHAGLQPNLSGAYAPRLDAHTTIVKTAQAASTLTNTSLFESGGRTGAQGITGAFGLGRAAEGAMLAACFAFALLLAWRTRPPLRVVVFAFAWGALLFAPTLLTRNEQLYYHNDLVAAAAVLLGAMAARATRGWRIAVAVLLVLLAANAEVSQRAMERYQWFTVSERLRPLERIAAAHRDVQRIVFVTKEPALWNWAITGDGAAPFVPALFGKRNLDVRVVDRAPKEPGALVLDVDRGLERILQ